MVHSCAVRALHTDSIPSELHATASRLVTFVLVASLRENDAVAMHHQFEQQQITLVRRELFLDRTEDDESRMHTRTFVQILAGGGIGVRMFPEWPKLTELRLVANVAKHAEGDSAAKLEELRPDLFVAPSIRDMPPFGSWKVRRRVYKPLSGEDLYVTPADLDAYFDAIIAFWRRLSSAVLPNK